MEIRAGMVVFKRGSDLACHSWRNLSSPGKKSREISVGSPTISFKTKSSDKGSGGEYWRRERRARKGTVEGRKEDRPGDDQPILSESHEKS